MSTFLSYLPLYITATISVLVLLVPMAISLVQLSGIGKRLDEMHIDIREIRKDLTDVRERLTRVETHVGIGPLVKP